MFLFDKCVQQFLNDKFSDKIHTPSVSKKKLYISMNYFGSQSEKLKKDLYCLISKFYYHIDLQIILVNRFTIGSFFRYKDSVPWPMRSSVIYTYSCELCASEYVGSTSRTLWARIAEHAGRSFRTDVSSPNRLIHLYGITPNSAAILLL